MGRKAEYSIDKNDIVEVAYEVFSEKGYAGTNLDDIAARLNTTRTPIYYYFKNKENLFCAVARQYYYNVVSASRKIFSKDNGIFDMLYEELQNVTSEERQSYMALMPDVKRLNPSAKALFSGESDPLEELYLFKLQIVEKAKAAGELRPDTDSKEFLAMWYYFFYGIISNSVGYLYNEDKAILKEHGIAYIEMLRSWYQNR